MIYTHRKLDLANNFFSPIKKFAAQKKEMLQSILAAVLVLAAVFLVVMLNTVLHRSLRTAECVKFETSLTVTVLPKL